jgi:AbrB family looped-hinge helix DNA binding protein
MRITSKGQVTIPQEIRERFGLLPDTEVEFVASRHTVQIVKSKNPARPTRGQAMVRRLRGRSSVKMSTDEILALTRGRARPTPFPAPSLRR